VAAVQEAAQEDQEDQAAEAEAIQTATALQEPEPAQDAEAVKHEHEHRQGQFLDGLQERMRPLIERTLDFMHEFGFPVSDDVLERFRKVEDEEPEQLTQLQKEQQDFDNENGVNLDDLDNDGPGMG